MSETGIIRTEIGPRQVIDIPGRHIIQENMVDRSTPPFERERPRFSQRRETVLQPPDPRRTLDFRCHPIDHPARP